MLATAAGVRPSFKPITRVGVFSAASLRNKAMSALVQSSPEFLV